MIQYGAILISRSPSFFVSKNLCVEKSTILFICCLCVHIFHYTNFNNRFYKDVIAPKMRILIENKLSKFMYVDVIFVDAKKYENHMFKTYYKQRI